MQDSQSSDWRHLVITVHVGRNGDREWVKVYLDGNKCRQCLQPPVFHGSYQTNTDVLHMYWLQISHTGLIERLENTYLDTGTHQHTSTVLRTHAYTRTHTRTHHAYTHAYTHTHACKHAIKHSTTYCITYIKWNGNSIY